LLPYCRLQVQRTCEALDRHGFTDIRTLEVLLRTYEVTTETLHTNAAQAQQPNKQGKKRSRPAAAATDQAAAADAAADGSEAAAAAAAAEDPAAAAAAAGFMRQVLAKPCMDARGHTGYLTFARRFVAAVALDAGSSGSSDNAEDEDAGDEQAGRGEKGAKAAAAPGEEQQQHQQTDSAYESGAGI
jgi:hypothetical protein